ncbi:MAG: DUF3786 domain-containing protein [Desulfofustis sp.]|nr:DUF3786 domain-containing protein [Desulfofustis sp.]
MEKSAVFEETYRHYLAELGTMDYLARADLLGVEADGEELIIPLYNRTYSVSSTGINAREGAALNDAVRVILAKYVLTCPAQLPPLSGKWMTYREFRGAGPLVSYFTSNTNKSIEQHFSGALMRLEQCCRALGAQIEDNDSYDLSVSLQALPRIPVVLNFNDADDMFPAACSILYRASAEQFLDMECLAMTGTLLAGLLLKG